MIGGLGNVLFSTFSQAENCVRFCCFLGEPLWRHARGCLYTRGRFDSTRGGRFVHTHWSNTHHNNSSSNNTMVDEYMQQDTMECATQTPQKCNIVKDLAAEFDKKSRLGGNLSP